MKIIVTGSIGSGKSTVVDLLARQFKKFNIISVDAIVSDLYRNDVVKTLLIDNFGTCSKHAISLLVFSDVQQMTKLKGLLDPLIISTLNNQIRSYVDCIIEFPLFFEYSNAIQLNDKDIVLYVRCSKEEQIQRVSERDNKSREQVSLIIGNQKHTVKDAIGASLYYITNISTFDALKYQIYEFCNMLRKIRRAGTTKAMVSGSYDPITFGHLHIIKKALMRTETLEVVIAKSPSKVPLFTIEERFNALFDTFFECLDADEIDRITVSILPPDDVIVLYAKQNEIFTIYRGIRNLTDLDYEYQLSLINNDIAPEVETLYLLTPRDKIEISSSMIKGSIHLKHWEMVASKYVPKCIVELLKSKTTQI